MKTPTISLIGLSKKIARFSTRCTSSRTFIFGCLPARLRSFVHGLSGLPYCDQLKNSTVAATSLMNRQRAMANVVSLCHTHTPSPRYRCVKVKEEGRGERQYSVKTTNKTLNGRENKSFAEDCILIRNVYCLTKFYVPSIRTATVLEL